MQCDCKCSLLAAELEGVKLDMAIMQRNIESNTVSANITRAEEVERLKQALANEREKNRQLEEDISVLVSGRNSEIAELNDIINSHQNKLESKGVEAIHKPKLDITKDYLSNETKEYLPSKQNTSYSSAKQDGSGLCLNKEGEIECELPNQAQTQNYASQEIIPSAHLKSNVCKQKNPSIYPSSQDVANSKGYFRKRHRTRSPQIRGQQRNRYNTSWFRYILQHNSPDWIKHLDLVRQVTVPVLKCPAPITNNQ